MRVFTLFWVLFIVFSPALVDRAMLYHADSTTVQLFAPEVRRMASGVVIGERQVGASCAILVGTAKHVVRDEPTGQPVLLALGSKLGVPSKNVTWSENGDAGAAEFLVPGQCDSNPYRVAIVAANPVDRGQSVFGSGFPVGHSFFSWGKIAAPSTYVAEEPELGTFISVIYPSAPGNSGGPLFDIYGRVVGVLSGGYPQAPMLAFFASAAQLREAAALIPGWDV